MGASLSGRELCSRKKGGSGIGKTKVGKGSKVMLVQTPTRKSLLIGGGSSPSALSEALGRRLPFGKRRLDWLVLPSVANESISALPTVLERFPG